MSAQGLTALRNFVRRQPEIERCELCAAEIGEQHRHLIDPQERRLICACEPCAILFAHAAETKYRRVPRDIRSLDALDLSDQAWNSLAIPIGLAFIFRSSVANQMIGVYPSPAGATETVIDPETWTEIIAEYPALEKAEADVEAVLINRMNGCREYFIVPIDECYKLTGVVRKYWRGFSGGLEGWEQIRKFFDELKARAYVRSVV